AAQRALDAARKAQAEMEKAQKALNDNKDVAKKAALQDDFDAKKATAEEKWADAKVAGKEALEAAGPQGQAKTAGDLKALDSKNTNWTERVDAAQKEKPDIATITTGNTNADAAAKRVAGAYAEGGGDAAAKQLRSELESANTPQERSAVLRSAMPVVDRITKDLGANGRHADEDWPKPGRNASTDPEVMTTRGEFDQTVADLEASVELAGDKEAAFHIAHDILQVMPGGTKGNSANNLLGLLGLDLGQSSPGRTSMLETALSAALIQPDAKAPAGTVLATPLDQRNDAARLLSPDMPAQVTVKDWTDDQGVRHDGTIWHEIEQNPDLFLTADQRKDIAKRTDGWPADEVLKEKTAHGLQNLREQNPGQDVDNAKSGDTFTFKNEDPRSGLPKPLDKAVQTAADDSKAGHPNDLQYGADLDALTNSPAFRKLNTNQQLDAVGQFDRTITQLANAKQVLTTDEKDKLRELIGSSNFHDVNVRVQDRLLGMFSESAKNEPALKALNNLVDLPGFRALDNEAMEFKVLSAFQHDEVFRGTVGKLAGRTDLSPADQRGALEVLTQVQAERQLYDKSNAGDRQKIMDSMLAAATDPRFRGFNKLQKDETVNQLVKYGDQQYALKDDGVAKAIEAGSKAKPPPTPMLIPTPGSVTTAPKTGQPTPNPSPGESPSPTTTGPTPTPTATTSPTTEPTKSPTTVPPKVATDTEPPKAPTTPTKPEPPTLASVGSDLTKAQAGAKDTATSKETINDPLRRVAGEDPVSYAYEKLAAKHHDDKAYLKLLDEALPQQRRDFTRQQVKDLVGQGKPDEAMKLLSTQLNATKDPAERKQLWETAGQPTFSRSYFDQQIDKALATKGLTLENLGKQFKELGENAPPEAANLMLDAIKAHTDKGPDDPLWQFLTNDVSANAGTYEGLSLLVERADSLGGNRADEVANFYATAFDKIARDPKLSAGTALMLTGGPEGGLRQKITDSIADHGAAKLSVALFNAARKHANGPDMGGGRDWTDTIETKTRNGMRDGIKEFRDNVSGDVEDWQKQNKNALRLVQDYGGLDPEGVARALAKDRKDHPDTYFRIEDDKPVGVDVAYAKMEQRGIQVDGLMRDLIGLNLDFDKASMPAEKQLGDEIKSLDTDPLAMSTLKNNVSLDEHRADQLNFGHFAPAASPWNPTAVVGSQRDHVDKLVRDYHVPPELATKVNERTDRWETDLRTELGQGDKVSYDKLKTLTDEYQKDVQALLKDKVPNGGDGALVKPSSEVVQEIRTTLQGIGTTTSTLRLTMNWFRDSGDQLLRAYSSVAFRRGVNGAGQFDPNSELIRNAARLGLSDEKSIQKAFDFNEKMQAEINKRLNSEPGKTKLSDVDIKELTEQFKREAPQYGPPKGYEAKSLPDAMKTSERVTRGLGMLCFFGSAVNNGVNAAGEKGVTSSDVFAGLFGSGAVIEAYRSSKGLAMEGGKLQQAFEKMHMGPDGAEQLSKVLKSNALGSAIAFADFAWAYEDFTGETLWGNKVGNGQGDSTAGLLTSGVVLADLVEIGAAGWRARLATMAATQGGAIAGSSAAPVIGWVAAGLQAAFLAARFAYGVTKDKNQFEFEDNKDYADMVKSLGFTEDQARELMNQSGGNTDVKVDDWEWFVPGWNSYQSLHSMFGSAESFFQEGGMGPMHALNPLFDANNVPQEQRLQYLQSLSPDEMKKLIGQTHKVLDDEMKDDGEITKESTAGLESWMRDNKLWKSEYLGVS
ncbi:MAG TPA: hypothetical protein VFY73_02715, partial [Ideonella sp.]|nr:hypothetical protein [Ideonella sp.]